MPEKQRSADAGKYNTILFFVQSPLIDVPIRYTQIYSFMGSFIKMLPESASLWCTHFFRSPIRGVERWGGTTVVAARMEPAGIECIHESQKMKSVFDRRNGCQRLNEWMIRGILIPSDGSYVCLLCPLEDTHRNLISYLPLESTISITIQTISQRNFHPLSTNEGPLMANLDFFLFYLCAVNRIIAKWQNGIGDARHKHLFHSSLKSSFRIKFACGKCEEILQPKRLN